MALERGLNDENCATGYDDMKAYTPAWAEKIYRRLPRAHYPHCTRICR
ncbi:hypothetical protein LNP25_27650 [Klebsiella variicola subsp. variicola]|nr:hypothetical protein [Klebsiella variicola subsp. variicola]